MKFKHFLSMTVILILCVFGVNADVGITDMRLVGDTVRITGDGYDRLVLQADYANNKLLHWNQNYEYTDIQNPWLDWYSPDHYESYGRVAQNHIITGTSALIRSANPTYYNLASTRMKGQTVIFTYWSHDTTNNYYQYQFYIDSDHSSSQDIVIETYTPDNIDYTILEAWNQTSGAYEEFWNGSTSTFTNNSLLNLNSSTTGMNFTIYESGQRGDTVSPIGGNMSKSDQTVSAYYGCVNRTLELYTLPMDDGADSSTAGASQLKIRRKVVYIHPGYATYEFEDSINQYYGLDNINGDTLMLAKAGTQNVTYLTYDNSTYSITGMTVESDETEIFRYINITFNQTPTSIAGLIINQSAIDIDTDSDGDDVPDAFEYENITANKNAQSGELKWDYIWDGAFNIVNSTGYIYYTNLINGSGLVGTEIQTAGTQNMSMNTAGAGKEYNFTINSGTTDWINITSGFSSGVNYSISNSTVIETQTADASGSVNFTTNLVPGTYIVSDDTIPSWDLDITHFDRTNTSYNMIFNVTNITATVTEWGFNYSATDAGYTYYWKYWNGTEIMNLTATSLNETLEFMPGVLLPEGVYYLSEVISASTIIIPTNAWGMVNNWTVGTSFSNIATNESNDVCYTYYNVTTGEWASHYPPYSWNSDYVIPIEASVFVFVDAETTITATIVTPANTNLYTGWNMLFVEGTDNETIADIKSDVGANCTAVWAYNSTAGAYTSSSTFSVQPCQGVLVYITQDMLWMRSDL